MTDRLDAIEKALESERRVSAAWEQRYALALAREQKATTDLAAERIENARLRRDDQNVMAELDRTLKVLAGTDDLSAAMHMLGPDEHLSDLAMRVKADLAALRACLAEAVRAQREGGDGR